MGLQPSDPAPSGVGRYFHDTDVAMETAKHLNQAKQHPFAYMRLSSQDGKTFIWLPRLAG